MRPVEVDQEADRGYRGDDQQRRRAREQPEGCPAVGDVGEAEGAVLRPGLAVAQQALGQVLGALVQEEDGGNSEQQDSVAVPGEPLSRRRVGSGLPRPGHVMLTHLPETPSSDPPSGG